MRLTEDEYKQLIIDREKAKCGNLGHPGEKNHENNTTVQTANMERTARNESMAKKKGQRFDKGCRIHVHHRTNRLTDPDGRSIKAAIDGLVEGGLLPDDSAKFIKEISQSQEVVKGDEETIITITEAAEIEKMK